MSELKAIRQPVEREMREFQLHFKDAMRTTVPLVDRIMRYIVRRKGKQIRPLFVYLSAAVVGKTSERSHTAATLIELLHTATLVHDDVVDESEKRRGFFSINALWKTKVAVLIGDYLLSRGLLISIEKDGVDLLHITSRAVQEMSEGELLQIEKARRLDITEDIYFDIIRRKTASLIAACCAAGAASSTASGEADEQTVEAMRQIGEHVGIAFQIKDDLLDYEPSTITGKPRGGDIRERKMTLPLIHTLAQMPSSKRRKLIRTIKYRHQSTRHVEHVMQTVIGGPGIEYAEAEMARYRDLAVAALENFPASEARAAMIKLVDFTIRRRS
ncbi:MAG: polyprenyl synthetase family protein [Flavobacteriales bacterium]|nr:polyprenyl synthetase family protein [Flavobacteriales bacterium]